MRKTIFFLVIVPLLFLSNEADSREAKSTYPIVKVTVKHAPLKQDTDKDRIPDIYDNCPTIFNPTQYDIDIDGKGDLCDSDIDDDTIPNNNDNCPEYNNFVDELGALCFREDSELNEYEIKMRDLAKNGYVPSPIVSNKEHATLVEKASNIFQFTTDSEGNVTSLTFLDGVKFNKTSLQEQNEYLSLIENSNLKYAIGWRDASSSPMKYWYNVDEAEKAVWKSLLFDELERITDNHHLWYHKYYMKKWNDTDDETTNTFIDQYCSTVSPGPVNCNDVDAYCYPQCQYEGDNHDVSELKRIWMSRIAMSLILIKNNFYDWDINALPTIALRWLFSSSKYPIAGGVYCPLFRNKIIKNPYACIPDPQGFYYDGPDPIVYHHDVVEHLRMVVEVINKRGGMMPRNHREFAYWVISQLQSEEWGHGTGSQKYPLFQKQYNLKLSMGCHNGSMFLKSLFRIAFIPTVNHSYAHHRVYLPTADIGVTHTDNLYSQGSSSIPVFSANTFFRTKKWLDRYMWLEQCPEQSEFEMSHVWALEMPFNKQYYGEIAALNMILTPQFIGQINLSGALPSIFDRDCFGAFSYCFYHPNYPGYYADMSWIFTPGSGVFYKAAFNLDLPNLCSVKMEEPFYTKDTKTWNVDLYKQYLNSTEIEQALSNYEKYTHQACLSLLDGATVVNQYTSAGDVVVDNINIPACMPYGESQITVIPAWYYTDGGYKISDKCDGNILFDYSCDPDKPLVTLEKTNCADIGMVCNYNYPIYQCIPQPD